MTLDWISPADRLQALPPYVFARLDELKARAREQGLDLIDLGMGNPDGATPQPVVEAAIAAVQNSANHGYPPFEGTASFRSPDVTLVVVVFGHDFDLVCDEVSRVETHTKLANHGNVRSSTEGLHECFGARLGNRSEVVDEIRFGHSDTRVLNSERVVGFVSNELDLELRFAVENGRVREGLVTDLVESIRRVGNQFAEENLFVRVKGVDD